MSSFAYSVAIKLSVANLASQGVKILAADLLKAHGAATNLQSKLSALKMVAVGYGFERAGQGILGFLGKAIEGSKEYTHQLALMNAAGFTHREIAESVGTAWKTTSSVITSTAAGNLETLRELRSAFGKGEGMVHAYAVLPQVQRVAAIMESVTGRKQSHVGFDMVKAIELGSKGALSVESLMKQSEMMSKALVQMGGTLTVSDFHQAIKQTRAIAPYLSDEFKYQYLPTLIQEMKTGRVGGAQQAGTAIASLGQVVVGQMIPKSLISNWIESGLINASMVKADPHNRTMSKILPGGVLGQNEFGENPYLWAQKYAAAAVEKLMASKHLDQYGAILALTHNRVAAFAFQTLINKGAQFERDRKLITEGPSSYQTYQRLLKSDPQLAEQAMHSQWQNLLAIIGYQILPKMIPFMIQFANGLNTISTWMARHPLTSSTLVIGLGILGVSLDLAGKALMAAGIIRFLGLAPMLASAIGGIGAASAAASGAAGVGGLLAVLTGPVGLVLAAGAAAAAIGGLVYALWNHSEKQKSSARAGQDIGIHRGSNPLLWVQDTQGRGGNTGHWIGKGSGYMNAVHIDEKGYRHTFPKAGSQINSEYSGTGSPYITRPQPVTVNVTTPVYIDGQQVANSVTKKIEKGLSAPNTGSTAFNPRLNRPSVAGGK